MMETDGDSRTPSEMIEAERAAHREELPDPDEDWPPHVRAVYRALRDRLFDWG